MFGPPKIKRPDEYTEEYYQRSRNLMNHIIRQNLIFAGVSWFGFAGAMLFIIVMVL